MLNRVSDNRSVAVLSKGVLLLSILLLAWAASRVTWLWLTPQPMLPPASTAPAASAVSPVVDLAGRILGAELFGRPQPVAAVQRKAPVTRLDLRLYGVVMTERAAGYAMIGRAGGPAKLYVTGTELPGGALLREVHQDHVLISVGGKDERLLLKPEQEGVLDARPAPQGGSGATTRLGKLREQVLADPAALARQLTAVPVQRAGKLYGFSLQAAGEAQAVLTELGLRQGDVVTAVNGIVLDSPAQGVRALAMLRDARQVVVKIDRRGRQLRITRAID